MRTERMVLGLLHTNCYIVYNEDTMEAMLIDPATHADKIIAKIEALGVKIKYIILTHAHSDHLCALDKLAEYTGAEICIGSEEEDALNNSELNLCNYFRTSSPVTTADILLKDGDCLKLGEEPVEVIFTPGHTKGGISLVYDNCVITGDTLFAESVGRSDFATSSTSALMDSIKNKLYLLDDSTVVYPGHGDSTTIGHEKVNNPFVW